METLIFLIAAHFLCDFPLQGNYLSMAKNRHGEQHFGEWPWALAGHSAIHAGAVYLITGNVFLAVVELVAHAKIDDLKCAGKISYNTDQFLHIAFKFLYVAVLLVVS